MGPSGNFEIKCSSCGKKRFVIEDVVNLNREIQCSELSGAVGCTIVADDEVRRIVRPRTLIDSIGAGHIFATGPTGMDIKALCSLYLPLRKIGNSQFPEGPEMAEKISGVFSSMLKSRTNATRPRCRDQDLSIAISPSSARVTREQDRVRRSEVVLNFSGAEIIMNIAEEKGNKSGAEVDISNLPKWAASRLVSSRKIPDLSEVLIRTFDLENAREEAIRKEFTKLKGDVVEAVDRKFCEDWCRQFGARKVIMSSRALFDLKKKEREEDGSLYYLIACRWVPRGFRENVDQENLTGFAKTSRRSAPTLRATQHRLLVCSAAMKGWWILVSADITRAYPRGGSLKGAELKFVAYPANCVKTEGRRAAMGFEEGKEISIIKRPLCGTQDAGEDWASTMSKFLIFQCKLPNSICSPCFYSSHKYEKPPTDVTSPKLERGAIYTRNTFVAEKDENNEGRRKWIPRVVDSDDINGVIGIRTDDLLAAGEEEFLQTKFEHIGQCYECGSKENRPFMCVGRDHSRLGNSEKNNEDIGGRFRGEECFPIAMESKCLIVRYLGFDEKEDSESGGGVYHSEPVSEEELNKSTTTSGLLHGGGKPSNR